MKTVVLMFIVSLSAIAYAQAPAQTTGSGAPSNPCGTGGQDYIDQTNHILYHCPSSGSNWVNTGLGKFITPQQPIVLAVTGADVTCGTSGTLTPCTSATTITGLSQALPTTSTQNWAYECDLIYSQATANAANGVGVQTATNAPTNLSYSLVAYTALTANGTVSTVGVSSTTAQTTSFTPTAAVGTKLTLRLFGTIEGASGSGTTFNAVILTGSAADLLTIYRGSKCVLFPQ